MAFPKPSDRVLAKLASIAVHAEDILVANQPTGKAPIGLQNARNERRRTMEKMLLLLADPEVRAYLADIRESRKLS